MKIIVVDIDLCTILSMHPSVPITLYFLSNLCVAPVLLSGFAQFSFLGHFILL